MKHTNFGPAPRSMSEALFMEAGCAVERPHPRRSVAWAVAGWVVVVLLGVVFVAASVRAS